MNFVSVEIYKHPFPGTEANKSITELKEISNVWKQYLVKKVIPGLVKIICSREWNVNEIKNLQRISNLMMTHNLYD